MLCWMLRPPLPRAGTLFSQELVYWKWSSLSLCFPAVVPGTTGGLRQVTSPFWAGVFQLQNKDANTFLCPSLSSYLSGARADWVCPYGTCDDRVLILAGASEHYWTMDLMAI